MRNVRRLLDFIAELESRGNYNAVYGHANAKADLSRHTLDQIIAIQTERIRAGAPSSAIGRYQFLRQTLQDLAKKLKLTGEEPFTPELQDRLATSLLERRGLNKWLAGDMTDEDFANSLAREWASLPVVTPLRGAHRQLKPGQSYYAGDDLNKALTTPLAVLACLRQTRADNEQPPDVPPDVELTPERHPGKPGKSPPGISPVQPGFFSAIANLLRRIFG